MKRLICNILFLTFTLFSQNVISQTNWSDDFSDSTFKSNPIWSGDTAHFIVNHQYQLQLNAPSVTANSILTTPSQTSVNAIWQFYIELLFNPSTNNFGQVYFMSNTANIAGNVNGYFIQLGANTSDEVQLYKQTGTNKTLLLESTDGILNNSTSALKVKIERTSQHCFKLFLDTSNTYFLVDSIFDDSHLISNFFVINCNYTSTRSDKFIFDDITVSGQLYTDVEPPKITSALVTNIREIELNFSESVDSNSTQKLLAYKLLNNGSSPDSVYWSNTQPAQIKLNFATAFSQKNLQLFVENVEDLFGNEMEDTLLNLTFINPSYGAVVFSEIMFDPTPPVLLPELDYLEIYNHSQAPVELQNWKIEAGSRVFTFENYVLQPDSFAVIVPKNRGSLFLKNAVASDFPDNFLSSTQGQVLLYNAYGGLVDEVFYSSKLYQNPAKDNGGWSIENKDLNTACKTPENWAASLNLNGGTPGYKNSTHPPTADKTMPFAKYLVYKNKQNIQLHLSEPIQDFIIESTLLDSIYFTNAQRKQIEIRFKLPIDSNKIYPLFVNQLSDCSGNISEADTLYFGIPKTPKDHSIYINEILFNPKDDGADFVEIYNANSFCVSTSFLRLAKVNPLDQLPQDPEVIFTDSVLLAPFTYFALSEYTTVLNTQYQCGKKHHLLEVSNLPSMPNSDGSIGICTAQLQWIDFTFYNEKWHHPLVRDAKGVSLERVTFSASALSQSNWHSTSYSQGFATPALPNSQLINGNARGQLIVFPKLFTPDNNGQEDATKISFELESNNWVATLKVYDVFGREIKTLINNKTISANDAFIWNGMNNENGLCPRGTYVIFAQLWHPDGRSLTLKSSCRLHYD